MRENAVGVGSAVGKVVGTDVGVFVGAAVGDVGTADGADVGKIVGTGVGTGVGTSVGSVVGWNVGVGRDVGTTVGVFVGVFVGVDVGKIVGTGVGTSAVGPTVVSSSRRAPSRRPLDRRAFGPLRGGRCPTTTALRNKHRQAIIMNDGSPSSTIWDELRHFPPPRCAWAVRRISEQS